MAVGSGSVWVVNAADGTVQRIDGSTGAVLATIATTSPSYTGMIAYGDNAVWLSITGIAPLLQIDPASNAVARRYLGKGGLGYVAHGDGSVWIWDTSIRRYEVPR